MNSKTKSQVVREIVQSFEESGEKYTSGDVMKKLLEVNKMTIHRSHCITLMNQVKQGKVPSKSVKADKKEETPKADKKPAVPTPPVKPIKGADEEEGEIASTSTPLPGEEEE